MQPLITVLIASYNRLPYLKRCIESCQNQEFENFDVLVVDDGSEMEVRRFLTEVSNNDPRVNIYYQENRGAGSARQHGLLIASGQYILILDSDDSLELKALRTVAEKINASPNIDFFYSNNTEVYPNGKVKRSRYKTFSTNRKFLLSIFASPRVPYKHSGSTFKKDKVHKIGGYDSNLQSKIDIDFIAKCLTGGLNFNLIEEPIVRFSFHKDSISRKKRLVGLLNWWKIIDRYCDKSRFQIFAIKLSRSISEVLKFIVESISLR